MVKEIKCITKVQQYYMRTRLPDWFTACSHLCNIEIRAAVVEDRDVFKMTGFRCLSRTKCSAILDKTAVNDIGRKCLLILVTAW